MMRTILSCLALFAVLLGCRQPQTTTVTYDAMAQKLLATPASGEVKAAESQAKKITSTPGRVQVYMGIGDTIATSLCNVPTSSRVTFTRVDLPREQVQMPASWPLSTGKTAAGEPKKPEAPVAPAAVAADVKAAAPSAGGRNQERELNKAAPADETTPTKLAGAAPTPSDAALYLKKRLAVSKMREALALAETAHSEKAYQRLQEADGLILEFPGGDTMRLPLARLVAIYKDRLLAGDEEQNLGHHDQAAKALDEAAKAIAAGQVPQATKALDQAKGEVEKFDDKANNKAGLLTRIADYQKRLTEPDKRMTVILPPFTYTGQDFDVQVDVAPAAASAPAGDKADGTSVTKGFYIQGRRDHDWMLFTSTGLALSRLVDDEYGVRDNGATKSLVKLSPDKARGEFLVFLNFQNRGVTGQAIPVLFGLGVGSTGADMRYYLGPGLSLGSWGALHLGLVGGRVKRLRDSVDAVDYKGTDPSAELRSVFETSYFLSITARF